MNDAEVILDPHIIAAIVALLVALFAALLLFGLINAKPPPKR